MRNIKLIHNITSIKEGRQLAYLLFDRLFVVLFRVFQYLFIRYKSAGIGTLIYFSSNSLGLIGHLASP